MNIVNAEKLIAELEGEMQELRNNLEYLENEASDLRDEFLLRMNTGQQNRDKGRLKGLQYAIDTIAQLAIKI